ncbi:MAG: amidohydrolase [Eubacteriales bacterium]|jgi:5-methylthioadenosine/S-adenosylhomocysteine deaminase|nr:amidohydrolase [Eubacteriales bacterium]
MKTRLYHARILPLDGTTPLFSGELIVSDGRIVSLGTEGGYSGAVDREIDCRGNLIMPGFKNAHTHSGMTFLRSLADDLPLQRWLTEQVFPKEAQLTPDDVYVLTKLAIMEYLTSGITMMFDMYFSRESIAAAAIDTGFRAALVGCANDYGGTAQETADEYAKFSKFHPLITYRLGFHAEYTSSEPLIRDLSDVVQQLKQPFYTHLNETVKEVESCIAHSGMRTIEYLDSLGLFNYGGGGYHCVHVSEKEMDIMQSRGMRVVTCPGSNTKLASGVAPVYEYLGRGIPVAIGTDGPASNNCLDFFREMFLTTGLQKLGHGAEAVGAMDVLTMACKNGAYACGFDDCDSLAVGKQADLILIDLNQPNMQPLNNIEKNIVYSGSKQNVALVMIAGKVLYERGEYFIGEDPERIYAEANRIIRAMK